ncbi:ADAMTS-like protein 2 [Latimeria chalumnae]|uniref:ADAMTS-like protein 2 n=1 Tax=Latimeria chalumnae TaxID=7897 RepID=UPI00313E4162
MSGTRRLKTNLCSCIEALVRESTLQSCPNNGISFKQQQCSAFNAKAFGRRHYHWVPLYPDDYINISNKPCDLQCTTTNRERQLMVPAQDGTSCRDRIYQGVCIGGRCEPVGCDGTLYSSKTTDRCGMCDGDGSTCYRISGTYRKGITQLGYIFITNIPAGATDIQIIERRRTENILALSDEAGHFFFNGNSVIDNPRNFRVAGTVFKYRRPSNLYSDGFEYIIAQGPTNQGLNVMYYNLNGKMPHITFEYILPRLPMLKTAAPVMEAPLYFHISEPGNGNKENDLDIAISEDRNRAKGSNESWIEIPFDENEILNNEGPKGGNFTARFSVFPGNASLLDSEGLVWEFPSPVNLSDLSNVMFYERRSNFLLQEAEDNTNRENRPPDSESNLIQNSPSRNGSAHLSYSQIFRNGLIKLLRLYSLRKLCRNSTGSPAACKEILSIASRSRPGNLTFSLSKYLSNQQPGTSREESTLVTLPESLTSEVHVESEERIVYRLRAGVARPLVNSNSSQHLNLVSIYSVEPAELPNTESNEFEVESMEPEISLADMYRWKVSAYAPCSSTCTTGITSSYAICVRYDGVEVDESYCDAVTRPEPTHEFCTGRECPARWETSRWSECSRTCGEGYQFRTVRCWKMIAPGFDSSVYDELCEGAELPRPVEKKLCKNKGCGPQWEVSAWSECSARCGGKGVMKREVRCSVEAHLCDESSKPVSEEECAGPLCDRRWSASEWGPCSGPCGEGRMTRYVVCKNTEGKIISSSQCDPASKPLAVYPCGDKNCPAHWVEQEWEQCNATCGRGVKIRQVLCAGLENGMYKEYPESRCKLSPKSEEQTACFERPCSKWFTTSWSQCSKTCGSGVKVREVKCYQGEELGQGCDPTAKPEVKQTCQIQPCPTEAPDENCQDKVTANCALVLKVKLCTHWYYRKACCRSCRQKSQ